MEARTPAEMGEEGRKAYGITERMPLEWDRARFAMKQSPVVKEILGEIFVEGYLSVNKVRSRRCLQPRWDSCGACSCLRDTTIRQRLRRRN